MRKRRSDRDRVEMIRIEDVLSAEIRNADDVDHEYLAEVFRDPVGVLGSVAPASEKSGQVNHRHERMAMNWPDKTKLLGLALSTGLLAAAVLTTLTVHKQPTPATADRSTRVEVTGSGALGAFAVDEKTSTRPINPATYDSPLRPYLGLTPITSARRPDTEEAIPTRMTRPTGSGTKLGTVREFYRRVAEEPQRALDLLSPELAQEQPHALLTSWTTMRAVHLDDARLEPDDSVFAIVTMHEPDGHRLRLTQLLEINDDKLVITGAKVVSAQHS